MHVHGELDNGLPYTGFSEEGHTSLSAQESTASWAVHNGCSATPEADTSQTGITIYGYTDCDNSREVLLYATNEGSHWPPLAAVDGRPLLPAGSTTTAARATQALNELIWEFFERNAKPR